MLGNGASTASGADGAGRSTNDLLGFDNVRNNGIIETPTSYSMLIEVSPRDWLTLSEQRRSNLYVAYLTYLRGLSFPTQVLTMTTTFDADQYYEQFLGHTEGPVQSVSTVDSEQTGSRDVAADGGISAAVDSVDDAPLLEYGRIAHVEWLDSILTLGDVRDRRFFVAVGVKKGVHDSEDAGWLASLRNAVPGGSPNTEVQDETPYLDEVWARTHRVASQLPRTEVGTEVLDSRSKVLEVLYLYYRGQESPISFDHSVFTNAAEETLTDPATGQPLDLEAAFEEADRRDEFDADDLAKRTHSGGTAFDGRVAPEYVSAVANSGLLRWYARHVAPIGSGTRYATPRSVYAGATLFLLGTLLAIGAFAVFSGSGSPDFVSSVGTTAVVVREVAFVLAASSVPLFLLSLVVLLPSSVRVRAVALAGAVVAGIAIYLFSVAYPAAWDASDMARTTTVLEVYGAGMTGLVLAVALSLRTRRSALSDIPASPTTTTGEDGRPQSVPEDSGPVRDAESNID